MKNEGRLDQHKKNEHLENVFPEMQEILGGKELELLQGFSAPQETIYLIVGAARSGSTLMYQFLAKSGLFGYPTNFISCLYSGFTTLRC